MTIVMRIGTLILFVLVIALSLVVLYLLNSGKRPQVVNEEVEAARCTVVIPLDVRYELSITIKDPQRIRALIENPLKVARKDLHPARYVILGRLSARLEDGSQFSLALFLPVGHYKTDTGEYMITDLSALHAELKSIIERTIDGELR